MTRWITTILLASIACMTAAVGAEKSDLPVLYLGTVPSERATGYAALLDEYFSKVRVENRETFDPATVKPGTVVILDWSQADVDIMNMDAIRSPVGPREAWSHPTVLLGSAGLLLATPWEIAGSSG